MSGPKVDRLELERRRQQELQAANQAHARIVTGALDDIRSKVLTAKATCTALGAQGEPLVAQLADLQQQLCQQVMDASSRRTDSTPEGQHRQNNLLVTDVSRIMVEAEQSLHTIVDRADELHRRMQVANEADRSLADLEGLAALLDGASPAGEGALDQGAIDRIVSGIGRLQKEPPTQSNEPPEAQAKAMQLLSSIQTLLLSDAVDAARKNRLSMVAIDLRKSLLAAQQDPSAAPSLQAATYVGSQTVREAQSHAQLMESLYVECLAQQSIVDGLGGQHEALPELWELSDDRELNARLQALRTLAEQLAQDALIAHALDTVMARHGYTMARSVCLAEAPDSQHRLFLANGTDVGIHAFMGQGGTVMLETVAIGQQIRGAQDGVEVRRKRAETAYDRARLLESQRAFCEQHQQFVAELAELGVVMHLTSDMEPSEEHACLFEATSTQAPRSSKRAEDDWRAQPGQLAEREMR